MLDDRDFASLRKRWSLAANPTPAAYRDALAAIARTTATPTVLLSPPALREDPDSVANRLAGQFARITRDVGTAEGATYAPLVEQTIEVLRQRGAQRGAA